MKIEISLANGSVVEIADFEKIIIGNRIFLAEEFKAKAIPLDKKEFFTVIGQKDCLVVNSAEVAYVRLS